MFRGRVEQAELSDTRRWSAVKLEIMQHPMLEDFSWETPDMSVYLCRERCRGSNRSEYGSIPPQDVSAGRLLDFLRQQQSWPLDWQAIIIDHKAAGIEFRAGHGGVAPLYIRSASGRIQMSWDFADFYADASLSDVDPDWTAFRLTGNPPYAATTMFRNLYMVTERSRLHVDAKAHVSVHYPDPAPYYLPTELRPDVDIPAVAGNLIEALLARWSLADVAAVTEFSGGMDSAVIAGVLARMYQQPPLTAALLIAGPAADQQRARRQLAIKRFGFIDEGLPVERVAMIPPDLASAGDYVATPYNADLQRPLSGLFETLVRKRGAQVIATGTGGDELHMLHAFEQAPEQWERNLSDAYLPKAVATPIRASYRKSFVDYAASCDRAPFPLLPISILEAQAARAPLFARHGLWPVSALAQPKAVRFYRSLPKEWRIGKRLHRQMLLHLGYPASFLDVPLRENFEPYLATSLIAVAPLLARDLRHDCRLHDLGIVDADALASAVAAIRPSSSLDDIGFVFHAYNMEAILRRVGSRSGQEVSSVANLPTNSQPGTIRSFA